MQSHGPKRVYTPHSLEFWFNQLENEWAGAFTDSQLEKGREIYRDGQVRELELTDRDAIVHRRVEKKDEYAVIEWTAEGLTVRSSSTDLEVARALAVAGLHEIEELVADEISPLPGEPPRSGNGTHLSGVGNGLAKTAGSNGNGNGNGNGPARPAAPLPAAPAPPAGPARPLVLVFKTRTGGLSFQAEWMSGRGKSRVPALGPEAHANGNGHVSSSERAKLIGLAAYARKAHFHYNQETGVYLMESLVEIPNFLKTVLPAWRRLFAIELDDKAANLTKGTRTIEVEAVAERATPGAGGGDREHGSTEVTEIGRASCRERVFGFV
jgi:hypothetical protein